MRVLLDECVDRRLAEHILGHDVKTVPEAGWAALAELRGSTWPSTAIGRTASDDAQRSPVGTD